MTSARDVAGDKHPQVVAVFEQRIRSVRDTQAPALARARGIEACLRHLDANIARVSRASQQTMQVVSRCSSLVAYRAGKRQLTALAQTLEPQLRTTRQLLAMAGTALASHACECNSLLEVCGPGEQGCGLGQGSMGGGTRIVTPRACVSHAAVRHSCPPPTTHARAATVHRPHHTNPSHQDPIDEVCCVPGGGVWSVLQVLCRRDECQQHP